MTEIKKAMQWLVNGETGRSSEFLMAYLLSDGAIDTSAYYPHDPSDFNRCVQLLDAVPSLRVKLNLIKNASKKWAALVVHWEELEVLLRSELGQRSAPKTYERMREIYKLVDEQND